MSQVKFWKKKQSFKPISAEKWDATLSKNIHSQKVGSDEGPLEELTVSDVTNLHFNFKQSLEKKGIFLP